MKKSVNKIGLAPGTVVFTGNQKVEKVRIHHLRYDTKEIEENFIDNHSKIIFQGKPNNQIDWYDIRGLHDTLLLESIGQAFGIHSLILEDIADIHQRPKFEEYPNGAFIIIKAISFNKETKELGTEQVGLFFRERLIVSFQETESDLLESVRKRLQRGKGKVRQRGADYLTYALLDVIVDNYFIAIEQVENTVELLEEELLLHPEQGSKIKIHKLKKELLLIRKAIIPFREAVSRFSKSDSEFLKEENIIFIRDLYDHVIQIIEIVESYRDVLNGLQDLFISEVSYKMNQIMQVLTIISVIFIPLTFFAGIYGMNFAYMPELQWKYSYPLFWFFMLLILLGQLFYFKKKKWF